jgi:hypothetical protein
MLLKKLLIIPCFLLACLMPALCRAQIDLGVPIPTATMAIDGLVQDWAGIEPFAVDFEGDSLCETGTDLRTLYLAQDTAYLYWRVDTVSGTYALGTPENGKGVVVIFMESWDGEGLMNEVAAEIIGNAGTCAISYRYDHYTHVFYGSDPSYGVINEVAEGRIPLSLFNPLTIGGAMIHYFSGTSDDPCDFMDHFHKPLTAAPVDFSTWEEFVYSGNMTFTERETELEVVSSGSAGEAWGNRYQSYADAAGVLSVLEVVSGTGDFNIGMRKNFWRNSQGNLILVELFLDKYDDQQRVMYRVRERDDSGNTLSNIARGVLGNWNGGWTVGQAIVLGLAAVGNEIILFTPANGAFVKVQPSDIASGCDNPVSLYAWVADGSGNVVQATFNNTYILSSSQLMDLEPAAKDLVIALRDQTIVDLADMNADEQFNLADVIFGLQLLSGLR